MLLQSDIELTSSGEKVWRQNGLVAKYHELEMGTARDISSSLTICPSVLH